VTAGAASEGGGLEGPWRRRIAFLMGVHVVGTINVVSVLAMAPVIQPALGLNVAEFGLLATAYSLGQATGSVPAGITVDRVGIGRTLVGAMAGIACGSTLLAIAETLPISMLGMYFMGCGYCFTNPSTAKGVLEWFPQRRRATAMGAKQTGVPIGGVLAAGNGALATTVVFGLCCLALIERRSGPSERRPGFFSGFRDVFRDLNYGRFVLANFLYNFGQNNFFAFLTLFVTSAARGSQEFAGLCLGVTQATSAISRFGWGVVSDTVLGGRRKRLVVGIGAVSALLLAAMVFVSPGWGTYLVLLLAVGLGITIASYAGLMQTISVEAVEPRLAGSAVGYNMIGTHRGAIIGPPIFGALVDATGGYTGSWLLTAAVVGCGVLLLARGFREGRR